MACFGGQLHSNVFVDQSGAETGEALKTTLLFCKGQGGLGVGGQAGMVILCQLFGVLALVNRIDAPMDGGLRLVNKFNLRCKFKSAFQH